MLTGKYIDAFLYFGYIPKVKIDFSTPPWSLISKKSKADLIKFSTENDLINKGVAALKKAITSTLKEGDNESSHFLPLSGGLDSRTILGGMLENLNPSQIHTATFGMPATWDFKIGPRVAKFANVKNNTIDFSSLNWDNDSLVNFATQLEAPISLFKCFLYQQIQKFMEPNDIFWCGFMGDALAGSTLFADENDSWNTVITKWVHLNRYTKSTSLEQSNFRPEAFLPDQPLIDKDIISFDDQINLSIRELGIYKNTILPNGFEHRTPFSHPDWITFILQMPRQLRKNKYIYRKIVQQAYPSLFEFPTKTRYGLPLDAPKWQLAIQHGVVYAKSKVRQYFPSAAWAINPLTNYMDFDEQLRNKNALKNIIYDNTQDLKKRNIVKFVNINSLWNQHLSRRKNHANALQLLASLEIYFKAQEKFGDVYANINL